jgi:site-specific recombinase XerC
MRSKGRKQRTVPLTIPAQTVLTAWLNERAGRPTDPLFVTRTGRRLSRDAIEQRVSTHAATAARSCPSLNGKQLHPHVLRHYVDGWVMWPAGVFTLLGLSPGPVPAT